MTSEVNIDDFLRTKGHTISSSDGLEPLSNGRTGTKDENNQQRQNSSRRSWLAFPGRLLSVMKTAFLLGISLVCACISASGFAILSFLLLTRSLAPPTAYFEKELYFDYTKPAAVASANFCKSPALSKGSMENARFLPPGQTLNLWLALETPESHGTSNRDVFQVAAELVATDGRVAATASRPCLVKYRSPLVSYIRMLARLPLVLCGWYEEKQLLKVELFKGYKERADVPFCVFRVALMARANGGELPGIYSARVRVDLNLGLIGRALYKVRPGTTATYILGTAGLLAFCSGGLASLALLAIWGVSRPRENSHQTGKARQYDEVSSEAGWSEVSTGELDSEFERERELGGLEPGASASDRGESPLVTPLSAQALRRWDARSASQLSTVSSDDMPMEETYSRSNHKKRS